MRLREHVREAIRAEIRKQNAIEKARQPLELIAETSLRFDDENGSDTYEIVDKEGNARTKSVDGNSVAFTIQDLVAELRESHPSLFQPAAGEGVGPVAVETGPAGSTLAEPDQIALAALADTSAKAAGETTETVSTSHVDREMPRARRDWLTLAPTDPPETDASEEVSPSPAALDEPIPPVRDSGQRAVATRWSSRIRGAARVIAAKVGSAPTRGASGLSDLPTGWAPSRATQLRVLYVIAFVGGLLLYATVDRLVERHPAGPTETAR